MRKSTVAIALALLPAAAQADPSGWTRFRGPNGMGVSTDAAIPVTWSETENLAWKTALPGPGASSPIVVGEKVFVTCYSGYGESRQSRSNMADLKRHVVCVDAGSGNVLWSKAIPAAQPEDRYAGRGVTEHGYATNTPTSDGERLYVFLSKSGVFAFDLDGKQLWQMSVGRRSGQRRWGSAASLIVYRDTVIVNAADEGRAIVALDTATGKQVWELKDNSLDCSYGTPVIARSADGKDVLVIGVPRELWGLNPDTGKLRWYAETGLTNNVSPSVVVGDGVCYIGGGYPRQGLVAVRTGGRKDVSGTHVAWKSSRGPYVPTPVLHDGHLYWLDRRGSACCVDAETGRQVYRERVETPGRAPKVYASCILVGDKLYATTQTSGVFVLAAKPTFEQIANNRFDSDPSIFNGSPAVSRGRLFLRSNRFLYCVSRDSDN